MSFIWPPMLLSLIAIPLLAFYYLRLQGKRQAALARFGSMGILRDSGTRPLNRRRHVPAILFLAGLALLMVALARPEAEVSLPRLEGTVILAFDVSGSMAAEDLEPTRIEAAKVAARNFIDRQPDTMQIGIVAFSDSGLAVQPPTNDKILLHSTIDRLKPELGTSIADGILASLDVIFQEDPPSESLYSSTTPQAPTAPTPVPAGTFSSAAIVLLTDGENTAPPEPFEAAQMAADLGVRVYTVGIGSPAGIRLEVNGFTVHTRLDEPTLTQIAEMTSGDYYNAQNEEELRQIYENLSPQFVIKPEKMEITALVAGASLVLLMIGGVFSLMWFSRLP